MSEIELRWMTASSVAAAAAAAPRPAEGLIARDRQAIYWLVTPAGRWSAFRDGRWVPEEAPTTIMEVPAGVPDLMPTPSAGLPARTDEPTGLEGIGAAIDRLRGSYERGVITSGDADDVIGRLHVIDIEGAAWTRGFRSRAWYRWSGGRWMERPEAPEPAALLTAGEFVAACPACGAEAEGRRFCGECGAEQPTSRVTPEVGAALSGFLEQGYGTLPEPVTEPWSPPPVEAPPSPSTPVVPAAVGLPPAAAAPAPRRGFGLRRLWGLISTVLGIALLVFSIGRVLAGMGGSPGPTDRPVVPTDMPLVTPAPTPADVTPEPTPFPTEVVSPAPTSASNETWFADAFDTEAAWFVGEGEYFTTVIVEGHYAIEVRPTDLPTFLWAASEGPLGDAATIEATVVFALEPLSTEAGIVAQAGDLGTRLVFLVSRGGSWALYQDDTESFRTLLQGTSDLLRAEDPLRLRMDISATSVAVSVNDTRLDTADVSITLAGFGIALRATEATGYVAFDEYVVTAPGR